MGRFIRDAVEVEAYQYNGNNLPSIIKAFDEVGFELRTSVPHGADDVVVYIEDKFAWVIIDVGSWIVRKDGELKVHVISQFDFFNDFRQFVAEENGVQDQIDAEAEVDLRSDLTKLLNSYNVEEQSGTPDFILADVALRAIEAFNDSVIGRAGFRKERWQYDAPSEGKHRDIGDLPAGSDHTNDPDYIY